MSRFCLILLVVGCATTEPAGDPTDTTPYHEARVVQPRDDLGPVFHVPVDNAPQLGPRDAAITVVAFTDFECRFCARALPSLHALQERYGDDIRIVFRHFPLSFHRRALAGHEVAQEIFQVGGNDAFWRFHDAIFADRSNLNPDRLRQIAGPHRRALEDHRHRTIIETDIELGRRLGVRGTPTFFFNGKRLSGARPVDEMVVYADDALARAQLARSEGASAEGTYHTLVAEGLREQTRQEQQSNILPAVPPVPDHAPRRGNANAPIVIQMFSDFECRFCVRALDTVLRVLEQYPDEVSLVFRHMPLRSHRNAEAAANAAIEARAIGGDEAFWRFHDALLPHYRDLGLDTIERVARELQLDAERMGRAVEDNSHRAVLAADLRTARAVGASGTPTFVIGNRVLRGARPFLEFEEIIDELLDPEAL